MVLILWKKECKFAKTLLLCAPKCPGSEVREEYKRGFEYLLPVHPENDPNGDGFEQAKAMP
jgi:ketol-acid reductoisomerase